VDADPSGNQPLYESLNDFELGYSYKSSDMIFGSNIYYMHYNNQLILTGQINNVGSAIMTNVDNSYRSGIELTAGIKFSDHFSWDVNTTISRNKIRNFTEYVENWDNGGMVVNLIGNSDIAFSPGLTSNSIIAFKPCKDFELSFLSNYVGKQYIDNTSDNNRKLNGYLFNNIRLEYTLKQKMIRELQFNLLINNIFNANYETNAWVYSYFYEGKRNKMDGYFPQAGTNFIFSVRLGF
jgi:iron complex outermembrane receptor protein